MESCAYQNAFNSNQNQIHDFVKLGDIDEITCRILKECTCLSSFSFIFLVVPVFIVRVAMSTSSVGGSLKRLFSYMPTLSISMDH